MSAKYYAVALETPLDVQAGDVIERDGNTIKVTRNNVVVAQSNLIQPPTPIASGEITSNRTLTDLFLVTPMPGQSVACTSVNEQQSGAVTFVFSSGNNTEYASWAAVGEVADDIDANPEFAEKLLAAKAFRSSPDGANKATQVGASVGINCLADTPVVYTEAD